MQIEKRAVAELKAAPYNPRKDLKPGDAEYEKLKRSIQEFGYVEPVIWNKRTGTVVGGHQRLKVMKDLGYEEVDCVVVDLDEQKEKALNIALNKISGEWDEGLLANLLKDLDNNGYDITFTGFDLAEAQELFGSGSFENVHEDEFDAEPFRQLPGLGMMYGMGIDPDGQSVYVCDCLDYSRQRGYLREYKADGQESSYRVGIYPRMVYFTEYDN